MSDEMLPKMTREMAAMRRNLVPETMQAWLEFNKAVFKDGALPSVTKELIAVAVAHTTQCAYCIRSHTKAALKKGATETELMEAIWVAAEMRAGGAYAHSAVALSEMVGHRHPESGDGEE